MVDCRPPAKRDGADVLSDPGSRVLLITDASERLAGCCLMQVADEMHAQGGHAEQSRHELLGFISCAFMGTQLKLA